MNEHDYDVAVMGGGPAGATAGMYCARLGLRTAIIERKIFPRETLCGEFLSREVLRVIDDLDLTAEFARLHANPITSFRYCPENGRAVSAALSFTAFGLKRGTFDTFLLRSAAARGAAIIQPAAVERIERHADGYALTVATAAGVARITARRVIGAHGKAGALDTVLDRGFDRRQSRLNGVKFHVPAASLPEIPAHEIQIHTGPSMYCGVNVVNDDTVTLCFLERRSDADTRPRARINELLKVNPHFSGLASPDFEGMIASFPIYGAGAIFFGEKDLVHNGVFMVGDAARVIAPLAGDGLGMALESAQMLARVIGEGTAKSLSDAAMARLYARRWMPHFARRLRIAGVVQRMLLSRAGNNLGSLVLSHFPFLLSKTIEYTRG